MRKDKLRDFSALSGSSWKERFVRFTTASCRCNGYKRPDVDYAARRVVIACALLLFCMGLMRRISLSESVATSPAIHIKPYRILLVVDHQSDPYSLVVNSETDKFQPVAALLKAWSVPYDILRLDQQHLDASYLFCRAG